MSADAAPNPPKLPDRAQKRQESRRQHRSETRWLIFLPLILAAVLVFLVFAIVAFPSEAAWRWRASAISDFLSSLFFVCPAIICLLPVYFLSVILAWGAWRLHSGVGRPIERVHRLLDQVAERVDGASEGVNQRAIGWSARLAPLMELLKIFDAPKRAEQDTSHDTTKHP